MLNVVKYLLNEVTVVYNFHPVFSVYLIIFLIVRLAIQVFCLLKNSSPSRSVYGCAHRHSQACTRKGVSVPSEGVASGKALSRHLEQRRKFPGLARDPVKDFPVCPQKGWPGA